MRFTPLPLLFLLAAAGCGGGGTPAAGFTDPDAADRAAVLSYAHSLEFDTSTVASGLTHLGGTEVRWSPERRADKIPDAQLAHGRIIGVAETRGGTSPFGTPEGRSYVWVDSTVTGWRAVIIPDDPTVRLTTVPLFHGTRPFATTEPPRFRSFADSFPNGRCGTRCCIMLAGIAMTTELLQRITDATHAPR